jgi:hypothetical protein
LIWALQRDQSIGTVGASLPCEKPKKHACDGEKFSKNHDFPQKSDG